MSAEAAVVARLEAVSAVTAIVSTRIYNGFLPQNPTLPAILVERVGQNEFMHMRGSVGIFRTHVQVNSVSNAADAVAQAEALDDAVRGDGSGTSLIGWRGIAGGVEVTFVDPITTRTVVDPYELRQFRVMRDAFIWWVQ